MHQPPARRRIRPALAAAIGCGLVGGSLVGVGAFGFDKVEVSAAACEDGGTSPGQTDPATPTQPTEIPPAEATPPSTDEMPTEKPAETPDEMPEDMPATVPVDDLITGVPVDDADTAAVDTGMADIVSEMRAPVRAAIMAAPPAPGTDSSNPFGGETTIAPVLGPLKSELCPPPPSTPIPGPVTDPGAGGAPVTGTPESPVLPPVIEVPTTPVVDPPDVETPVTGPQVPGPTPSTPVIPTTPTTPTKPTKPSTGGGGTQVVVSDPTVNAPTMTRGFSTKAPPRTPTPNRTGTITRAEAIARAVSWVSQRVPYSQSRWWNDVNGVYRQDCSGYVAMAWRTDQRINYWTGNLGTISRRIASSSMKPGDILLLPGKHTVIFLGWANTARTKFHLFEEYRTGYPARFVKNASLSYYLDRGYGAYMYNGMRDTVTVPPVEPPVVVPPVVDTPTAPDPAPAQPPVSTTTNPGTVSIDLVSNATGPDPTSAWAANELLAQLTPTDWTPGIADDYNPESDAPAAATDAMLNPEAAEVVGIDQLIAAQQAVDAAEAKRLAASNAGMSTDSLTLTTERTSGPGYILAGGLGLLFLAIPLGAAARGPLWSAASSAAPVAPRRSNN